MREHEDFLASVELFAGLPREVIAGLVGAVQERRVEPGALLFAEGDAADSMFVVVEGWLEVLRAGASGAPVLLRRMGPREVGGLTSMAVEKTRSASLRAAERVRVLCVPRPRFLELLDRHPSLVRAVMAFLSAKVRGKTYQIASLLEGQAVDTRPRVALFDAKPYDRDSFARANQDRLALQCFDLKLGPDTARLAQDFQVVCAFVNDDLGAATLEALTAGGVQLVAMRCSGTNNVDLVAAQRLGLDVVHVPRYAPEAVAEHALALILTLNRKTHRAFNRVREGNFSLHGLVGQVLAGRTAGIVGMGAIGRCLAGSLRGMGMQVLAHDVEEDAAYAARSGVRYVPLDELVAAVDVISLHAPLLPSTHHLINTDRIARMKPGVMIINTGRGGLIDTRALIQGLKHGHIGAAGLDVYEEESGYFFEDRSDRAVDDDVLARLMTFPNVLITSHQAFLTEEALATIADTTLRSVHEFVDEGRRGSALTHAVRPRG